MSKRLILDIEISPTLAAVWGLWKQNIGINQITGNSEVLCWAAKWHGSDEVMFSSKPGNGKRRMIRSMHKLLNEADEVVTYNGNGFDLKILNQEFLMMGLPPPAPYRSIDVLATMKRRFRGTSNKLAYWLRRLGLEDKEDSGGAETWLKCMAGDADAWNRMETYNIQDVESLEQLFDTVVAWIPGLHPSVNEDGEAQCKCGSTHFQRRGTHTTKGGLLYQRYVCKVCGNWFRSRLSDRKAPKSNLVSIPQI